MRTTRALRWIAITATLLVALGLSLGGTADAKGKAQWVSAWGFSQQGLAPETVTDATVRMITRPTISGSAVRVTLQNTFGGVEVQIGAAYVGLRANGALLVSGSNQPLTFAGAPTVTIPPGGEVTSDPASLEVRAQQDMAVSLYLPGTMVPISRHTNARTTSYQTPPDGGNHAAEETAAAFTGTTTTSMWWVAAVDVLADDKDSAIVCLGDSITDGTGSTIDGYDRWHDFLALRLLMESKDQRATVNEGIGGNRINPGGASPAAVERLDRDVLSRAGVSHVLFFEGTNDVANGATSAQVIAGSQEIIDRVHAARLKIIGVTMIPRHNANWTPQMTQYRHEVNDWIRKHAKFDAVIDFDEVVRDPDNPDLINPILDLGDHVHPNPYGYLVMGRSIDLKLFKHDGPGRGGHRDHDGHGHR
jgi:lysophospholipase L1-like esterase